MHIQHVWVIEQSSFTGTEYITKYSFRVHSQCILQHFHIILYFFQHTQNIKLERMWAFTVHSNISYLTSLYIYTKFNHGIQSNSNTELHFFNSRINTNLKSMWFPLYKMTWCASIIYCRLQFIIAGSCSFFAISLLVKCSQCQFLVKLLIPI